MVIKKILITGASGFIGRKLAKKLQKNYQVVNFSRRPCQIKGIKEINDTIYNIAKYSELLKVDQVYHLAGLINFHPQVLKQSLETNLNGTKKLLEVCRKNKIKKFLFVSAGAVLGFSKNKNDLVGENSTYVPPKSNPYAYSKYLAEKEVLKYSRYFKVVIVNPSTVYGSGDKSGNASSLIKMVDSGKLKIFFPGGTSYIDIADLTSGLILAMAKGKNKERYILSAENVSYRNLINRMALVLGKSRVIFCLPKISYYPGILAMKIIENFFPGLAFINSNILEGFYNFRYFDSHKAKKELNFCPKHKIEDIIRRDF